MYPNKKKLWQIIFPRLSLFTYPWLSWNKEGRDETTTKGE